MTITGGIKVFESSKSLFKNGVTATATSNDALAKLMLDISQSTAWVSSGSDDTTTETLTISLAKTETLDRLFLLGLNFKEYTIQYYNGSIYVDFANVIGLGGALVGGIAETAFSNSVAYYEFDSITTDQIQIQVVKTQVVDAEKQLARFVATAERGTFVNYPTVAGFAVSKNAQTKRLLSGLNSIIKSVETVSFGLVMANNPSVDGADDDRALGEAMQDALDSSLIWLCGGRFGTPYFQSTIRGYRLKDLYAMDIGSDVPENYTKGMLINPVNMALGLQEVAG